MTEPLYGYAGQILRVDLSRNHIAMHDVAPSFARKWVGGSGFGAKFLYEQVPPDVMWDHPKNCVILASGPLGGTRVGGSGTFSATFKGPMTNLIGTSQANGFFGAFLKLSGFDAVIIEGASSDWSYLYIHDGQAELRDARHLLGQDTWETEAVITQELGIRENKLSVFSIGPAGENLVRFAGLFGDKGHAAAHNGLGAVLGAKKLKAIVVARGSHKVPVQNSTRLSDAVNRLFEYASTEYYDGIIYKYGTGGLIPLTYLAGQLPVKNYTTNLFPEYEKVSGQYIRNHFVIKNHPCWACRLAHVKIVQVTEGPYAGFEGEEPEFECINAFGPQIGNTDLGAIVMLSNLADRLGFDANECGWLLGWVIECYEKGYLSKVDLDGLDMTWGNFRAVELLLYKIAKREGCGDWLAEGVMRASTTIGGKAIDLGVYTLKGNTPRSHDHRARWSEMLDTSLSDTGTIESCPPLPKELPDAPQLTNPFSTDEITTVNAVSSGWRQFEDSLGVCRFTAEEPLALLDAFNAITGWDINAENALDVGRRIVNMLRVFNFRHGLDPELESPSPRYQSTPVDGPAVGISVTEQFDQMKREYWNKMGWDTKTGKPLPKTLKRLGLAELIPDLWPGPATSRT